MGLFEISFLCIYFIILILLSIYGSHRYQIVWHYLKSKSTPPALNTSFFTQTSLHQEERAQVLSTSDLETSDVELPFVLIQLPIYNERYVITRLIEQMCQIKYPLNRFCIQVLDDSQ